MFATTAIVRDGDRSGRPTCALLTDDGLYWPLTCYFRARNFSLNSERGYALAIRQLMDWTSAKHPDFKAGSGRDAEVFSSFLNDMLFGTSRDDEDPTGLWWRPTTSKSVRLASQRIADFSDWLASAGQGAPINPMSRAAGAHERLIAMRAFARQKRGSMMAHVKSTSKAAGRAQTTREVHSPGRVQSVAPEIAAFPVDKIDDLLWKGFEREKFKNDPRPWVRWNIRDILITLICLYGGTRESEPMHLWVDDVYEEPLDRESCKILIHSPEEGLVDYVERLTGRNARASRLDYLKTQCGGKLPLTMRTGRRHSGWKGGLLTRAERKAFQIFWIDPSAGRLFARFWNYYIAHARPVMPNTPWAFLTAGGQPLGARGYAESFKAAVEKIGLRSAKTEGTTPHGLRHRYGQWLNELGADEKLGQMCMHHASPLSQAVYRRLRLADVAAQMAALTDQSRPSNLKNINWSPDEKK